MRVTHIDPLADIDFPPPPAAAPPDPDRVRRQRQLDALIELREITGAMLEDLKGLPEALLAALSQSGVSVPACVLQYYAPSWRGAIFDPTTCTYAVEDTPVYAGRWEIIRALVQGDFAGFDALMAQALARTRALPPGSSVSR